MDDLSCSQVDGEMAAHAAREVPGKRRSFPLLCVPPKVLDLDVCIEQLYDRKLLAEPLIREICERTKELLMRESNVVHISSPVTVVGDIHG
ncbi:MAG: hypothetical protein BJ554DRAFT_2856 [Olpidium bornovanus]|uniref:Uncharacterized protein n=1 Tax=Olpidium bornovanus TaxID=278681 RepID=A0A8H8DGC4_9FUNG|nr:MAG: hypothetical protein BJ554DRAFT_2856 [Olpidium bornovanus]